MQRLHKLRHLQRLCRMPSGAARMNCLAALIGLMATAVLFLTFHATPAGAGLDAASLGGVAPLLTPVPLPALTTGETSDKAYSLDELNRRIQDAVNGSKLALRLHVALLELGRHRIAQHPDYSATFLKQERIDGEDIQEPQVCQLKLRHSPFSVYMKWLEGGDEGRELLYVEGQYENRMQVKLGGPKGNILPRLKLDPHGSMAMAEARHPVTEMGLLQLADIILKYRKRDLGLNDGLRWQMLADQKFMDQDCFCFVVEYASKEVEPLYRKSITYVDKQHCLPVGVKNFAWPGEGNPTDDPQALDEATLIEYYGYKDLRFETRLSDADFDKSNAEYKFRR
ncbi:MAG: DUF1571 domain-containing protein [Planctomycetaceae bacterium]